MARIDLTPSDQRGLQRKATIWGGGGLKQEVPQSLVSNHFTSFIHNLTKCLTINSKHELRKRPTFDKMLKQAMTSQRYVEEIQESYVIE